MSLIGSVFERKATGKGPPKPPSPSASKTGFPPVQHRSKSAFLRGRDESRKRSENGRASGNTVPQVLAVTEAETPKSNDDGWREQISRENEARVGGMSEEERQAEIQEIIERFGSGIGDILKKARAAREKQSSSGARPTAIAMNLSDGFDKMEEVPVTSPTIEERRAIRRVGSPPPALSTASTRPSSRAENRKLRFAELIPTDVHVYESAPPSPRKRAPLLLTAPPDEPTEGGDKPISLGTWKGALQMQTNPVASEPEAPPEPDIAATNHENADPEVGSPEYIRRKYFPQIPANDPSLAWIEENSTASSSGPALRFDLNGVPITSAQSSTLPTHLGLHHHAEGSRAGYTLDDIFLLTRSTVPAQRTVMFGVLAGIVRWILKAKQDPSAYSGLDGAEEIKGKEEELRRRILAAGVSAMGDRGSPGTRAIEVVWECLVGWDRTSSEHFASVEMEQKYKSANKPKSAISTLSLDFTLPQIADSFGLGALPSESLVQLLELVHRLAKENSATADAIVGTSKLVSNMVQKFLLALPSTSTVGISFGPNPLALEVLIILASASRTNATALVEYADALLRFIITLPSSSQFTRPLATTLLSLTLKFYTTLASYGLYANIATTATAQLNALHRWILEEHAVSLSVDYLQLLHAWIICATDPHRTTPHHDLLWSQVVGWRWDADILEYRSVAEIHDSAELWAAIWDAEAAWLEGSRVNAVRAGMTEREAVVSAFKHGFERGKESECVASCIRRLKQGLESCDEPQRLATLSTSASTLAAALRLWIACAPPATDTLVAPHLLLPFDPLSELSAHIVNHRFWSWLQDDAQTLRHPFMLAWCRPMTQLLYAFLRVSRCIPDVPDDLWFAQAFTVLSRLVPGDEDIGVAIIKEVLALAGRDFLSSKGLDVPEVIWDKGGFAILQPFLAYTLRPDKEKYIGPFHPTPQSILASTTQRLPSSSAISNRTESRGLPLDRTWCMSPVAELLQSGASPVFQDLPSSWDSSETEVVRASLLLARIQRGVLASYRLLGYAMSAEETVFTCMRVFMLEHGQPHHDSSEEVFRDPIVGRFLHDLLLPHTISSRVSSQNPREESDLEQVASRFLGPSTPFYQYYTDFVALYDAISFLHPIFTGLLLPPISMRYPLDYRKFLWNDYAHVLKNIRTPIAEVVAPSLKEYLYPVEKNAQLLGAYLRPLVKGELEQSEFLKKIAVHHISCNIWEDLGDGHIGDAGYDSARAAQLLRAVMQGGNTIIKDIVLYDAKKDGTACDLDIEKRKRRLSSLDAFGEKRFRYDFQATAQAATSGMPLQVRIDKQRCANLVLASKVPAVFFLNLEVDSEASSTTLITPVKPLRRTDSQKAGRTRMDGYWVGAMPYEAFVSHFMTGPSTLEVKLPPSVNKPLFEGIIKVEDYIYPELLKAFARIGFSIQHQVLDDSHPEENAHVGRKLKIDSLQLSPRSTLVERPFQPEPALLVYELRRSGHEDIVDDDAFLRKRGRFELQADAAILGRGQLAKYATEFFARQHRTHCFMVFLCHPYVRFIRWDRSAAVVTRRYDYTKDCTTFVHFLCCFTRLTDAEKGFDATVEIIREPECLAARIKERLMPWATSGTDMAVLKMEVPHRVSDSHFSMRSFYVWKPLAEPSSPLGRGTRGYPAVEALGDEMLGDVVFLKDQWRSHNFPREIETLEILQRNQVRHVPTPICGGDIHEALECMGRPHVHHATQSSAYVEADWYIKDPNVCPETRVHTRFVTAEVGAPLKSFPSSKVFLQVVHDALIGHQDAYTRCDGLLHRDVSASNILILPNMRGLLNDWDMARKVADMQEGSSGHVRTGTWPFISYRLLIQPESLHTVDDDIQSFFWVVLHHALRYAKHNSTASFIATKIKSIFFYSQYIPDTPYAVGGYEKLTLLVNGLREFILSKKDGPLEFKSAPLNKFFDEANQYFRHNITATMHDQIAFDDPEEEMSQIFVEALRAENWPHDDHAVDIFKSAVNTTAKRGADGDFLSGEAGSEERAGDDDKEDDDEEEESDEDND